MDILSGLRIAIDAFWYNLLLSFAGLHWGFLRGVVMMGYTVELVNHWLTTQAFAPLIAMTGDGLQVAVSLSFSVAMFVLGITYLLAAFVRLEVVNFQSAVLWYIAGALFFSSAPAFYQSLNTFRASLSGAFYAGALDALQNNSDNAFESLGQVDSPEPGLGAICDHLGGYLPTATLRGQLDALDIALSYLRADGPDVMGYPAPHYVIGCPYHPIHPFTGAYIAEVPMEWFYNDSYFEITRSPHYFDTMDDAERAASLGKAASAHGRLLTSWPLILLGVVEQIVALLITVAMGVTFISFSVAILFAFFKRTESIAHAVVNQWLELVVQTVVIALVQALVVALFLAGTASSSGMVVLGVGLLCLVFMVILLWSGIRAVWNSFNRLFHAFGQATGGVMLTPTRAGALTAGALAGAGAGALAGGSGALAGMSALQRGATVAQAAGVTLGGFQGLSGAARTLAHLPGVRHTPLGETAEHFTEGATTRQIARNVPLVGRALAPWVGASLLTNRDPDTAAPVSVRVPAGGGKPPAVEGFEDANGEWVSFTSLAPRRTGTFTPLPDPDPPTADRERQDETAERVGEELEQHFSEQLQGLNLSTHGGEDSRLTQAGMALERSADALHRSAGAVYGRLQVSGHESVAGVLGDVVRRTQADEGDARTGIDHFTLAERMAQALGVTPAQTGQPPVQTDLARFGLFADHALRLGLNGTQTESVAREVQASPTRTLQPDTREALVGQIVRDHGLPQAHAVRQVDTLERYARALPDHITAHGRLSADAIPSTPSTDPPQARATSRAMGGSQQVL